ATSRPSRVVPSRTRCRVSGRWPTEVNICGRVSTSLTGRPTTRAASAVKITCGQVRSPAPKPPPRYGTRTRTSTFGRSNTVASVVHGQPVACPAGHRGEESHRIVGDRRGGEGLVVHHLGGGKRGVDVTA